MLLQNFFAKARLHRVHEFFLLNRPVHYLYRLKSDNILGQRKTYQKILSMIDFV